MSPPPLIVALLDSSRSPLCAGPVELMETHISWVLLAGDHVYKIKKPVTLPFLDYGTLEKRKAFCEAELQLNRRFAPDLYLDVIAITGTPEAPLLCGPGKAIEYAVKMRRFEEAMRLDHLARRDELTSAHVSLLAAKIADFHGHAAIANATVRFGSSEQVLGPAQENLDELTRLMPEEGDQRRLASIGSWTRHEFQKCETTFARRKKSGSVRECHGDLHLGNLVLIDGRVVLFDCIEFNDDFRWIDVASELAFTLVDLLDHGKPGLACWLLNEWLVETGDFDALCVLRYYCVYRAMVRAKVAALRAGQEEAADAGRDFAAAREYLSLAETLTRPPSPSLKITCGVSGSGKSRASKRLLLADPACATVRLRSDVERKRLYGLTPMEHSESPVDGGIYSAEAHARTYRYLEDLAQMALGEEWSVIVDAAFLKFSEREAFHRLATEHRLRFEILACDAPVEELRRRVVSRKGNVSEATLDVLEGQLIWREPLTASEQAFAVKPVTD